jgi:phosphatidylglycerophosphate synthase
MSQSNAASTEYQPTSRRPIAGVFRKTADLAVRICLKLHIHADAISYASIVAAMAAGGCFVLSSRWVIFLLIAPLFCFVRLWFNMLDGMVAVAGKTASKRGEILNDLPDRISDVIIFVSVAHSGWCNPFLGYWAAIFSLLTAYVGMFGQAVGGKREFGGVMSKPWRMVVIAVASWTLLGMIFLRRGSDLVLDIGCGIVVLGCVQTMWVRLASIMRNI